MQLKKQKLFLCLLPLLIGMSLNFYTFTQEFLYPVAAIKNNGKAKIYVLHQKSINNIELLVWDPETKLCLQGLLSSYNPVALKILPSGDGFSFIDDARIRIKKFDKRSPKSIDIYEPVYDISQINWIDEHNFYVSAKKNNKFCIFHINENGLIKPVLEDLQDQSFDFANKDLESKDLEAKSLENKDYVSPDFMYPQKIGNNLFYIERVMQQGDYKTEHVSYKIAKTVYPDLCRQMQEISNALENTEDFDIKTKKIQEFTDELETQKLVKQNIEYLADFKNNPIAFLNMISETEGFFLKHPENICKHDEVVTFECFRIKQDGGKFSLEGENKNFKNNNYENNIYNGWTCENIFSFSVPAYLILEVPDSCLYESILPLLPKYYNNKIYYVNFSSQEQSLNIFSYNLVSQKTEKLFFSTALQMQQILFSPIFIDNIVYCGGKIDYTESCPIKMWINQEGCICMDLPKIYA